MAAAVAKVQYSAIVLGATGNVGGRIVQLLIKNPLCKKMVVVTRRKRDAFAEPKVSEVVVNQKGYGLGKTVVTWYATDIPPTTPK